MATKPDFFNLMRFFIHGLLALILTNCSSHSVRNFEIIAHRGASGYVPEHTLAGVAMAHGWGVDYIEADLVMTKDHRLVVLHDHYLDTTTNVAEIYPRRKRKDGRYYVIDFSLSEIKKLNVYERFNRKDNKPVFPKRFNKRLEVFKVPTFEEYIELIQALNVSSKKRVKIYPEIKKPEFHEGHGKDIVKATINTLRKYGYEESQMAIIQCFYPPSLKRLKKEFLTDLPLVQLIAENSWKESSADYQYLMTNEGLASIRKYAHGIGFWLGSLKKRPSLVVRSKEHNLVVHAYTHRKETLPKGMSHQDFYNYLTGELKVDGIFSDFADEMLKARSL